MWGRCQRWDCGHGGTCPPVGLLCCVTVELDLLTLGAVRSQPTRGLIHNRMTQDPLQCTGCGDNVHLQPAYVVPHRVNVFLPCHTIKLMQEEHRESKASLGYIV